MLIEAKNVSKWYGDVIALNTFSLEVGPGITGVVGPNGAGKSTFFRMILGLIRPSKGYVLVKGQNPWSNPELMGEIGYLPDHDILPDNISGYDYLSLTGGLRGLERWELEERIQKVSHQVDMIPLLDRKINGYSKGMRQRLKIAGAMIHDPSLLVLDEPLSGTDPTVRKSIFEIIESLRKDGKDVIISSHVLHDIERVTKNVVLLYRGRSVACGTISEIRSLLNQFPHTMVIDCKEPREVARDLMVHDWVRSVDIDPGGELLVRVNEPKMFHESFSKMVVDNGYDIGEVYIKDEDLESIFRYMMGGRL